MKARTMLAGALLAAFLAIPAVSYARPGGGETYSSRSSSSTGNDSRSSDVDDDDDGYGDGDGGGGAALIALIELCVRYPAFGVIAVLALVGFAVFNVWSGGGNVNWDSARSGMHHSGGESDSAWESVRSELYASAPPADAGPSLDALTRVDADFSPILFEDFVFRLYATAHRYRAEPAKLDQLAPYLAQRARRALQTREPVGESVTGVVVGKMRIIRVNVPTILAGTNGGESFAKVTVEFEANYSVGTGPGSRRFAVENWVLQRAVSARTRPPDAARRFPCPNCGAPWRSGDAAGTQKCASCGAVVDNGRFDWQVAEIRLRQERDKLPGLDQEVAEQGTTLPTKYDPDFAERWNALVSSDPEVTAGSVSARLRDIYSAVNDAWSQRDLARARGVLSDGLADYLQYWLDAYESQGMRNVLEDMRLIRHEGAKVRRDRYYDAITIRIFATGKDYVIRTADSSHVRGSRDRDREYSEYWTLIRTAARRGPTGARECASCGAALTITMAGTCSHCGTHVTAGEFDWVLSKIEQDDAYQG